LIQEDNRQEHNLEMIASENFASKAVMEAYTSTLTNKYAEGYPGKRYYGGCEPSDEVENLAIERACQIYDSKFANVQPHSGAQANTAVFMAALEPGDTFLAMDLAHGGHLTHGMKINFSGVFYKPIHYGVSKKDFLLDYDSVRSLALEHKPKMIIAGASAYPRIIDFKIFRDIADEIGALFMVDMAHISGLVAAGLVPSPFEYADVVTTTTHKSLRGPRGAMIFYRKGQKGTDKKGNPIIYDLEGPINFSVFPGLQGGPHNHTISGLACALKQAKTPEFKSYQKQVLKNSQALAKALDDRDFSLVSGGTENHIVLTDLRPKGVDGSRVERVLELAHIAANKNTVPGDVSAMIPGGLRMGSPALTSRGFIESDFEQVAEFVDRAVQITADIKAKTGPKLKDFREHLNSELPESLAELRAEVEGFAKQFPTVGFEKATMRYVD
jgi:glycine hydroxymethyltransferase